MKIRFVSQWEKKLPLVFGSLFLTATSLPASDAGQPTKQNVTYQVAGRDANSQVLRRVDYETLPSGKKVPHVHEYTELATGLNHLVDGQWVASKEEIDLSPDGNSAAATNGQHQVYFPGDIAQGVIELDTPDGKQLQSRPIALSYDDGNSTVLIAVLTNSPGYLVGSNQVIYPNAFTGIQADLRYTYTKVGFEQDIILQAQPPAPESFGLNPQTARLQVLTEFFNPPKPNVKTVQVPTVAGQLTDQQLNFGVMLMVPGKAFLLGTNSPEVRVTKQWLLLDGRQFLVEEVLLTSIANELNTLPQMAARTSSRTVPHTVSKTLVLPPQHLAKTNPHKQPRMQIAQAATPFQGFVLDYVTVSSQTGYTFRGDTTYYISGAVNLYGTNFFEGGAILKYASNASLTIEDGMVSPTVNWQASAYRPVILTAVDDNSVGEPFGSGAPSGYYANPALQIVSATSTPIDHFRVAYARRGIFEQGNGAAAYFYNGQIINCQDGFIAFEGSTCFLRNILFSGVQTNLDISFMNVDVQNSTFSSGSYLTVGSIGYQSLNPHFTNCIFANIIYLTNNPTLPFFTYNISGGYNGFYNSPNFGSSTVTNSFYPFQTVGGGNFYLTNGCNFFNQGTANIDPALRADLAIKTTCPPILYYSPQIYFSSNLDLYPQARRDTNAAPDLGYHYDPLDYLMGGMYVTNATINLNPGTAVGIYGTNSYAYGLAIATGAQFASQGSPANLNHIAEYNAVQEQTAAGWVIASYGLITSFGTTNGGIINCRFTDSSVLAQDAMHIQVYSDMPPINLRDCQWHGGQILSYAPTINLTNCLLERVYTDLEPNDNVIPVIRNNLVFGGTFGFYPGAVTNAVVKDNLFDRATIPDWIGAFGLTYDGGNNAYVTNCDTLDPTFPNDIVLTNSLAYQSGPFGNYYQPTNSPLIRAGSTTADQVGLYHYTVTTNEVIEGNNTVSIGYHYVAVDQYGNPLDSNADGIPDYLQDANENGIYDSGDLGDWHGLNVLITRPRNGSNLP